VEKLTFVPPWIPDNPLLAVVGQGPGPVEARRSRPFVGPAGEQMRAWLRVVELDPDEDVMWTNVYPYFRPEAPNYKPTAKEGREGYDRVKEEIGTAPSIACVLLVGGPASHTVFKGNMGQMHGRQGAIGIESAAEEGLPSAQAQGNAPGQPSSVALSVSIPTFACYHPSFYIRQQSFKKRAEIEGQVMDVLARVVEVIKGKAPELELPEPEYVEEVVIT